MSLECSYKDIEWCSSNNYKSDDCLCEANIIVPDSMSDILKVVSVKATVLISDKKASAGCIEITGHVRFNVLYISEDEKSQLCALNTSVPFAHTISSPDITLDCITMVTPSSTQCSYTLTNSRKLRATALIRLCATTYKSSRAKVLTDAPSAQIQTESITLPAYRTICSKNVVVSANSDLPAGKCAISKILKQSAHIADSDFKLLNNKAIVKGNILISLLYEGDGITEASFTIPFTEVVEAEGLTPSLEAFVSINASDWDVKPDTDLSGDYKMLDISVVLSVAIRSYTNVSFPLVKDIFLPGSNLESHTETITALTAETSCTEDEFIKEAINLPPDSPAVSRILDLDAVITDPIITDDTSSLTAEITVIYQSDDAISPINAYTTKIPVNHRFSASSPNLVKAAIKHIGYAITGTGSIDVRLGMEYSLTCTQKSNITYFSHCEANPCDRPSRASVVVCFVNKGDTLWSIAKKYNIPLSHLASANAMEENALLTVGEKLIIPR